MSILLNWHKNKYNGSMQNEISDMRSTISTPQSQREMESPSSISSSTRPRTKVSRRSISKLQIRSSPKWNEASSPKTCANSSWTIHSGQIPIPNPWSSISKPKNLSIHKPRNQQTLPTYSPKKNQQAKKNYLPLKYHHGLKISKTLIRELKNYKT